MTRDHSSHGSDSAVANASAWLEQQLGLLASRNRRKNFVLPERVVIDSRNVHARDPRNFSGSRSVGFFGRRQVFRQIYEPDSFQLQL